MSVQTLTLMESPGRHPLPKCATEECAECARLHECTACFEELVRRFQTPLLHFLIRQIRSHHDAEDLLQETFLAAHRKLASFKSDWRFSTWLFTIAHRLAISKKRRRPWFLFGGARKFDEIVSADDPQSRVENQEYRSRLWDEVGKIIVGDSFTAIWLSYVESMSAEEIGIVLSRSPNAVRILLHRARMRLIEKIGDQWKPGGES